MSGKDNDEGAPRIGDASHILDDEPGPTVERRIMPVPVGTRDVTPDGEVLREAGPMDQTSIVMPGECVRIVGSKELQADAKRMAEPCPACKFFHFPHPESQDYRMAVAMCRSFVSNLPTWMREATPGRDPDEYGVCEDAPHGKRILVHILNSCEYFQAVRPRVS